jgi:hypothetical protein
MQKLIVVLTLLMFTVLAVAAQNSEFYLKNKKGKSKLVAIKSGNTEVLIKTVDDSDVLWARRYKLANYVWLTPGKHTLSIMCQTDFPGGQRFVPGEITLETQEKGKYKIGADIEQPDPKKCSVSLQ